MKTQSTAIASVLCTLFAGFAVTEAGTETVEVTEGGITFTVNSYDDGRSRPYQVSWDDPEDDFSSAFKFNVDGIVNRIDADGDRYIIKYKSNGDLRSVTRTTSRRTLAEEDAAEAIDGNDSIRADGRRRLHDCSDCEDTVNTLLDYGVPSVCDLVGYGDPFLDPAATGIQVFCDTFGLVTTEEACADHCDDDCLAPLTIALEWADDNDLDLYVVEPVGGSRINYSNRVGTFGYLDQDSSGVEDGPEQYIVYGGISSTSSTEYGTSYPAYNPAMGEYWVVVDNYGGDYVPFTLTATTGSGDVILEVEDEFEADCEGDSHFYRVSFYDYVDNGCVQPDLDAIAAEATVEGDENSKGNRKK